MIPHATALLRSVSAGSLSFAGFTDSGPAFAGHADAWILALLRSVSASSLSFAGFADSGPALAGHAGAWVLALLRRGFAGQGTRILSGGLGQHEPHTT